MKTSKAVLDSISNMHLEEKPTTFEGKWFAHKSIPDLLVYCFGRVPQLGYAVAIFDRLAICGKDAVGPDDVIGSPVCVAGLRGKYSDFEAIGCSQVVNLPRYAFRSMFEYARYYSYADRTWSFEPEGPVVEPDVQLDFVPIWDHYRLGAPPN
jgi:hypothetical protein